MTNGNNILVKKSIFFMIVILLSLPMAQQIIKFAHVRPLKGAFKQVEKPTLTLEGWLSGNYQMKEEDYLNSNFGFRALFIRLYNQLDYYLFGQINVHNDPIIEGKKGYLFGMGNINEYLGRNFLGKDVIDQKVAKLKSVSDSLSERGIDLVVLIAAGHASYYPEYFPDNFLPESKTISNYDYFSKCFDSVGVRYIDFNSWFVCMKDTSRYPLFPKRGIHWSSYGGYLAADSLIRYIEKLKGVKLPHFKVESIEVSLTPKDNDHDVADAMNLLFPLSALPMAYPKLSIDTNGEETAIRGLVIGDSYYWMLYHLGFSEVMLNNGQFWYYNKEIYCNEFGWATIPISEIDIRNEVEKNDVVFILNTEVTLDRFSFGFVDKLYELYAQKDYTPNPDQFMKQLLDAHIRNIKENQEIFRDIEQKAREMGISTDEMLKIEAMRKIVDKKN